MVQAGCRRDRHHVGEWMTRRNRMHPFDHLRLVHQEETIGTTRQRQQIINATTALHEATRTILDLHQWTNYDNHHLVVEE
jgi:hypothetical protein